MAERRILFRGISGIRVLLSAFVLSLLFCATYAPLTFAEARQSTLTVQVSPQNLTIDTTPSAGGHFDHSSNSTISIVTDNYTGYRLSIASETTTNLISEGNDTIPSITSAITETDFSTSGTYNNKWGYKPSQYIVDNNGVDTVVSNTSYYLPAPSTGTGDLIDVTSASNSTANTYTLSFGVRVDNTQPAGEYEYTYVITAVANAIVYNITYNASTNDTVNNMPIPNPQALTIDGGTPVADSHATLSSAEPTRNDMFFNGWCTVATTYNSATGNYDCSGTTYQPGDEYPIDQTVSGENITLYAIWMADPFPIVWSQMGACEFHGATNGNITGSECTDYHNVKFIDTGVPLYNTANYLKDYEIHMTIDHYDPNDQVNQSGDNSQQTFVNDKLGSNAADGKAPGIVVRRSGNSIQFNSKLNDDQVAKTNAANRTNEFSVYRINNVIYYSVNGGSLIELQDITGFSQQFELNTWFGAYPSDNCTGSPNPCTNAKRIPEATFSNMYIKLGDFDESDYYAVTFNGNNGTPSASKYLVEDGSQIGTLPTATRTDWTFGGWYTAASGGTKITTSYVPTADTPLYAHWYKAVSQATITNDNISIDVGDTETINITNSAQLEPYTLVSSDTTVATVDQSTGVVTGVGAGTATITMTGTISHDTKTITVTVTQPVVQYTITFDPHNNNETSPWDETIDAGDDLTDVYPATDPTYTNHVFQGWWTAASGGTQISSSTQPSGTTTYHAQWKGTVALATVASNSISVATDGTATVSVTNTSDIEGFTFSSSDTTVATIDPTTGVITPLTAGTTNISITGSSSNTTAQVATVTVTQAVVYYTITFNPHNETASWDETITAGSALGNAYPATDPTYTNHVFQGWYTAASNGTLVTSATEPSGTTTYHAQWKGTVALATVASDTIAITTNDTATVSVTNTSDIEGFTFSSSDTSVATIDSTTGVITPLTAGTTNISITGTSSNTTNQIATVTVTQGVVQYTVYFNPHNGSANSSATVVAGQAIGSNNIPADPVNSDPEMIFMGWFTAASGGTEIDENTVPTANGETYHAQYKKIVCKLETSDANLHVHGANDDKYGYIADNPIPAGGDAYNCDVDYDGTYSPVNERFYYLSQDNSGNAVLYAWNSYESTDWSVGSSSANIFTYSNALPQLPSNAAGAWDNPGLIEQATGKAARFANYTEVVSACNNGNLLTKNSLLACDYLMEHTAYDSGGRTAIWLNYDGTTYRRIHSGASQNRNVVTVADPEGSSNAARPTIVVPYRLIEKYTPKYTISFNAHGGTPAPADIQVTQGDTLGSVLNAMPTVTQSHYIFQNWYTAETGGTVVDLSTQPSGDVTYHAQWKKDVTLATFSSNPINMNNGSTTTINVTNSAELEEYTFSSNDTSVATVNATTGAVTAQGAGSTNIVMTGTTSHETINIGVVVVAPPLYYTITFNPQNGGSITEVYVTPGDTIGAANIPNVSYADHALMRWYDTSNNNTIDGSEEPVSDMTIYAEWKLNVQQAVITNNDLTLSVGGSITVGVSNANLLEDYTFSSNNTSIATVNATTGVITGVGAGTTNVIMTGTQSGLTKSLEVDVTAAPVVMHMVTFNTNGGSLDNGASSTRSVEDNTAVGSLPTASKTDFRFFGWYTDDGTFYDEVYADEIVDDDVTYYAKWVEDTSSLPIVWSEINACNFNGNAVISGDNCTQNKTKKMVDTGISLFNTTNYQKDFEIGFTVVEYDVNSQTQTQATLVNSKYENSGLNYPGFVMRRTSNNFQLTSKWSSGTPTDWTISSTNLKTVKIVRQNGVLKYSYNGGALTTYYDTSSNTHRFDTRVWFGAAATSDNETPQRYLVGTLTDMYVRLGVISEYTVELDPGSGSLPSGVNNVYTITIGDPVGALPTPTAPGAGFTFDGWYYGNTLISDGTQFIPTSDVTLVAHYTSTSSLTPVTHDVTNAATRGYKTLVNGWMPQVSQFNEDTTTVDPDYDPNNANKPQRPSINWSTWGVAKSTLVNAYKSNYETNSCQNMPGKDTTFSWANGSVNCSKPDAYDTLLNTALNVYSYDLTNQTHGSTTLDYIQADDGKIRNMIPGESYYWEDASDSTVYGVVTATSSVNGLRWLDVGDMWNVRDLGGLEVDTDGDGTIDGKLKYGKLVRGGRLNTSGDNIYLLSDLGMDVEYDIANSGELSPDLKFGQAISGTNPTEYYPGTYVNSPVVHYNFDYGTAGYASTRLTVYNIMYDVVHNHKNIYFHCRVGSDRTGTIAYLLEGLLGVPDELRYEEYELTHLAGNTDRTRYYDQKSRTNFYKFLYMMGYVLEADDIEEWFLEGSTNLSDDQQLIADFKTAMVDYYP